MVIIGQRLISDREILYGLGLCPDCYELAHDGECVSDEEAEEER